MQLAHIDFDKLSVSMLNMRHAKGTRYLGYPALDTGAWCPGTPAGAAKRCAGPLRDCRWQAALFQRQGYSRGAWRHRFLALRHYGTGR